MLGRSCSSSWHHLLRLCSLVIPLLDCTLRMWHKSLGRFPGLAGSPYKLSRPANFTWHSSICVRETGRTNWCVLFDSVLCRLVFPRSARFIWIRPRESSEVTSYDSELASCKTCAKSAEQIKWMLLTHVIDVPNRFLDFRFALTSAQCRRSRCRAKSFFRCALSILICSFLIRYAVSLFRILRYLCFTCFFLIFCLQSPSLRSTSPKFPVSSSYYVHRSLGGIGLNGQTW